MASARQRVSSWCLKSYVRSKRSSRRSAGMMEMPAKGVGQDQIFGQDAGVGEEVGDGVGEFFVVVEEDGA